MRVLGGRSRSGDGPGNLTPRSRRVLEEHREELQVRSQRRHATRHASHDGGPHGHIGEVRISAEWAEPRRRRARGGFAIGHHPFKTPGACQRLAGARVGAMSPDAGLDVDPVDGYLEALASASPTPGGGSAASMVGALGAALVAMVARLTVGKPAFAAVDADARHLITKADDARQQLVAAMAADEAAFRSVMAAYRLPREAEADRVARRTAIALASREATTPPLTTARVAWGVLGLALDVARIGNPAVISDAAVAAWAAHAAIRASAINVRVNLPGARDPALTERCESELTELIRNATRLAEEVEQVARRPTP